MDFEIDYHQNYVVIIRKDQLYLAAASWTQCVLAVRGEDRAMNHFDFFLFFFAAKLDFMKMHYFKIYVR